MNVLKSTFDKGPESWCSYDYHKSNLARKNIFILRNDESLWHMSWTGRPEGPAPLDACCAAP